MSAATLAVALGACGCATLNYTDPAAPLYSGGVGRVQAPDGFVRIVTYNIRFAERVGPAIEQLRRSPLAGADIMALQEMDVAGVAQIASALGMHYVYYPSAIHPKSKRDFGNAILSPWPVEVPRKLVLPHRGAIVNQLRTATVATVRVAGRPLLVYSIHLGPPPATSGAGRRAQIEVILEDAAGSPDPVVILGDFNSRDAARLVAFRGYEWLTRDVGPTLKRFGHPLEFDHILVRGLAGDAQASAGVVRDGSKASDHSPVWARLRLEPAAP